MCFNCIEMLFNVLFHFPFAVLGKWQSSGKGVGCRLRSLELLDGSKIFLQQQTWALGWLLPLVTTLYPLPPYPTTNLPTGREMSRF